MEKKPPELVLNEAHHLQAFVFIMAAGMKDKKKIHLNAAAVSVFFKR